VANTDWYLYNFRRALIEALLARGCRVITVSPPGEYVPRLQALGCQHIPWNVSRKTISPVSESAAVLELRRIYRQTRPALVHHHTLKAVIYGSLAARGLGIKVVNSIAGRGYVYSSPDLPARLLRPVVDALLRLSLRQADMRLIFENRADLDYFFQKGFVALDRAYLIRSVGVGLSNYPAAEPPEMPPFTVGFAGRLLWSKGTGTFVEAARILQEQNAGIRLVLIGLPDPGNPESVPAETVRQWAAEGLVEWWGWQADMPAAYARLHALAFPTSYAEGVPTVLLEAGASERALIASDAPGCREVIADGENGCLVPPADPPALAERIAYLAAHPEDYHRLRRAARKTVAEHFSEKLVIQETIDVYTQLIPGLPKGSQVETDA
jgi:glycosyltransferase involved in cell wall biosynthesis